MPSNPPQCLNHQHEITEQLGASPPENDFKVEGISFCNIAGQIHWRHDGEQWRGTLVATQRLRIRRKGRIEKGLKIRRFGRIEGLSQVATQAQSCFKRKQIGFLEFEAKPYPDEINEMQWGGVFHLSN